MRMHALIASLTLLILTAPQLAGAKVRGSKHDLSGRGGAGDGMDQICYFCHTPHTLLPVAPAWSREQSAIIYTPYWSPTLEANVGQPTGTSKVCLSCHDGTIARSSVPDPADPGGRRIGPFRLSQRANLGSDLSDDHPISFVYDSGLALEDRELVDPATLPAEITLDSNDEMQCTSCHDPHVSRYPKFLAMDNAYSKLCLACHDKRGWAQSAHSTSPTGWNGSGVNPWPFSNETTVSANACASCHTSHAAAVPESLLVFAPEEENCFSCHDGSVAELDVASEFRKSFRHPLEQSSGVHVATEDPLAMPRHVECSDCHNPHAAFQGRALAPNLPGSLTGVAGVSASGTPLVTARYEFEICYRCHADGPDVPSPYIERQIQEPNIRLKLDIRNPSYHPVVDQGQNLDVPSLIYPLRETSLIYCSDCHSGSSDATVPGAAGSGSRGFGVRGPHGSDWPFLLSQPYSVADGTVENYQAYALCYKCHDRNVLLADGSTGLHHEHVVEQDSTCSVCHDPHGISATQGNRTNNSHLINFDISIVKPVPAGAGPIGDPNAGMGLLQFEDLGSNSGRCYLLCHGAVHNPAEY